MNVSRCGRSRSRIVIVCSIALVVGCAGAGRPRAVFVSAWNSPGFHVIAHRGGAAYAPENTLPALRRSFERGFGEVEVDVQLSLDEIPVLYHDHTLERKTGHSGSAGVYTADELRGFEIGRWFDREHPEVLTVYAGTPLVTLAELFDEFGTRLYYHLEIKGDDPRLPARLLAAVEAAGLPERVIVTSFSFAQIQRFRSLDARRSQQIPVCWLLERNRDLLPNQRRERLERQRAQVVVAAAAGIDQVAVRASEFSADIVRYARDRGLGIRAWGVETPDDERHILTSGSDGATTDWPDRLEGRARELR